MSLEATLSSWTGPSSATEKEKQERTERMIQEAIKVHEPFSKCSLRIYAKGSYANNTNVRADSDVDVAVECIEAVYWDGERQNTSTGISLYTGIWTPDKLRSELNAALKTKFSKQVDSSGSTAIQINSSTARVNADVVPCFSYQYHFPYKSLREGTIIFTTDGKRIVNYPAQQLANGKQKNIRTNHRYKKAVRVLKRIENAMVDDGMHREVPSFFVECLVYNCPDSIICKSSWTEVIKNMLVHIYNGLEGNEPNDSNARWLEVNECFYLFHHEQKWTRADGREFALAAWNYLGYG